MEKTSVVILVEPNTIVKNRIKDVLSNHGIKIYEALNRQQVLRILLKTSYKVDLIVSEVDIDPFNNFNGINLIKMVKAKSSSIPVVVLTSNSKKEIITSCLREGASDYILKPFNDDNLRERLLKYINIEHLTESTVLTFNLKSFLDSEIYKAKKGCYFFSLMSLHFHSSAENESASPYSFYNYSELIHTEMKSLFWDSDLYIQHGFQSHLGFFPFCDEPHTKIILNKIEEKFENIKRSEPNLRNYYITHAFATYPTNGRSTAGLLKYLANKSKG